MGPGLIVIIGAGLGFVAVAGVGLVFAGGAPSQAKALKRVQGLSPASPREARLRARTAITPDARRKQIENTLKEQERHKKRARVTIPSRLQQAGLNFTPLQFYGASAAFGVVVMVIAFALKPILWADALLGLAAAGGPPRWVLGFLGKRRLNKFTSSFSDAMDIIVRGIKSGLPVHDCLKIIAREAPQPLAGEFQRTVENIGIGVPLDTALEKMMERAPTNELRFFAIVMTVQQRTGGNLAEALANLSTVLRSRKLMREKIKALSAEATTSAMIIGALPPGVILLISISSPAYMVPMFHDSRGILMLIGCGVWMSLGIFVMRRMINFKF